MPKSTYDDTFCGLHKLETLALERIMLTSIPSAALHVFRHTGSLKKLDLSGNSLTGDFPPDAFTSVTSIQHLDLSYNPISYLNKWIENLKNLTHLFFNKRGKHTILSCQTMEHTFIFSDRGKSRPSYELFPT